MYYRRKAREIALQVLYELDVLKIDTQEAVDLFWDHFTAAEEALEPFWDYFRKPKDAKKHVSKVFGAPQDARPFSTLLIEGTWRHRRQIDKQISDCSEHWSISRMSKVDRSILRMAVYELLYCDDIPPKVTLNEAIDLGKAYGSENSGSFINGILDALYVKLQDTPIESHSGEMEDR
jgi:transcription antitermination protein NusB